MMPLNVTTNEYDYNTDNSSLVVLCEPDDLNELGAQLAPLYYIMFIFSFFGNGLVLFIIYRFEKLTTVTNVFLLNLVVSCLIFSSSLPFWANYMQLEKWIFGTFMCKFVGSTYSLGSYSSVLFLTLLTFDRHLAVVYSLTAARVRRHTYAVASCVCVWLVSILACIKPMILYNSVISYLDDATYCEEYAVDIEYINVSMLISADLYIQIFLFFLFPLGVILYCYIRITITVLLSRITSKFKTVRLICFIVLLFFACWAPYNIAALMFNNVSKCEDIKRIGHAVQVTRSFAYFYFSICPIFYTFLGKKFQNHFRQLLVKRIPPLNRFISVSQTSRNNTKFTPT